MKERVFAILTFAILIVASLLSLFKFGDFIPLYLNATIFSLGSFSSYFENLFGGYFSIFAKIVPAISLFPFVKRSFYLAFASIVLIIILPPNAELLLLPLILLVAFSDFRVSLIASFLLPFFSRLALLAMVVAFLLRKIYNQDNKNIYLPFFGVLSPPLLISIFNGDIFLPFLLSISSFYPYSPIKLFSPLFWFFSISLFLILLNGEKIWEKVAISAISYFFSPLSFIPLVAFIKENKDSKKIYLLFIVPLLLFFLFSAKNPSLPSDSEKIFRAISTENFSAFVPPEIYFQAKQKLKDKNIALKPEINFYQLIKYYKSLPLNPPLIGYNFYEADLILTRGNYPKTHNLRQFNKGYKLVWCGREYAIFGKEDFLKSYNIETLKYYSPYTLLPKEEEGKKLAILEIDKLLIDEPVFYEALRDKGRLLIDLKRQEEAIETFQKALKIKESGEIYNDLGVCYFNLEKYEEALNCYYKAIKLSPDDIIPRMSFAYTAMITGKLDDAILVLQDLNRAFPTFYPAYRLHYQAWGRKGEIEKAKEILRNIPKELRTPDENDLLGEK